MAFTATIMTNSEMIDSMCEAMWLYKLGLIGWESVERDACFIYGEAIGLNFDDTWTIKIK